MSLLRRGGVPADVRAAMGLERGERVLASARTPAGDWVVATDAALHLPSRSGYERLDWSRVERAESRGGTLGVRMVGERRERTFTVDRPGLLPETVRDRVTASIVVNERVRVTPDGSVRVVGRRRAGSDELRWSLVFDAGLDPSDPAVRAAGEQALREVREQTGV